MSKRKKSKAPFEYDVSSKYGAPMGRPSDRPSEFDLSRPLHIRQVKFYDGDYDKGGAYWGGGSPLFCVWDDEGHVYYTRASSAYAVKSDFPTGARFYSGGRR